MRQLGILPLARFGGDSGLPLVWGQEKQDEDEEDQVENHGGEDPSEVKRVASQGYQGGAYETRRDQARQGEDLGQAPGQAGGEESGWGGLSPLTLGPGERARKQSGCKPEGSQNVDQQEPFGYVG